VSADFASLGSQKCRTNGRRPDLCWRVFATIDVCRVREEWAKIGANEVVLDDAPAAATVVVGIPAKIVRR
jgi:serine acetyltransferase